MTSESRGDGWTIAGGEGLLGSLPGVISARIVTQPGGEIVEIHLLTNFEVSPKQTVRNVESALLAHYDLEVDHRKISVAQTSWEPAVASAQAGAPDPVAAADERGLDGRRLRALISGSPPGASQHRILFVGHQVESQRSHLVVMRVEVEWQGERYVGEASGTDLPRARLEVVANAALRAIENALVGDEENATRVALALDGVKLIDAFDRRYVLAAVNALTGRDVVALSGSATIDDSPDRAVILATLQATDRWVRGRI